MCLGSQAGNTCSNMQLGAACPENLPVSLQHRTLGIKCRHLGWPAGAQHSCWEPTTHSHWGQTTHPSTPILTPRPPALLSKSEPWPETVPGVTGAMSENRVHQEPLPDYCQAPASTCSPIGSSVWGKFMPPPLRLSPSTFPSPEKEIQDIAFLT